MNWFYHFFGIAGTGPYYAFWSGVGSDIIEFGIIITFLRMINCHEKGCWRIGLHYKGHVVCHKHRKGVDNAVRNSSSPG